MKTAKIIPTSTLMVAALGLALGLAAAPALADPKVDGCHTTHQLPCVPDPEPEPDPDPSGGGKALLYESDAVCGGATPNGPSYGQVDWNEKILWDPNQMHVHLKLQLKDVNPIPEPGYPVFGNFDPACDPDNAGDRPLCEGGDCTVGHVSVPVKKNRQGRTDGVLRICPHQLAGASVTVWLTVTVNVNDGVKNLRSTPVTMVLPENQVGDGNPDCI